MKDFIIQAIHILIFLASIGFFFRIIARRIQVMRKAHGKTFPFASIMERSGSFFVNVILQLKLYKHPVRGIAHAFIFYAFLIYIVHSLSQMIAGVGWLGFINAGIDPYEFSLVEYITLGIPLTSLQTGLMLSLLVFIIAFCAKILLGIRIRRSSGIGYLRWHNSPMIQWSAIIILFPLFLCCILLITANGREFYEDILYTISLLVFVSIAIFAIRRWFLHADGLDVPSQQSYIVLLLIGLLMLSTLANLSGQAYLNGYQHFFLSLAPLIGFLVGEDPLAWQNSNHFFWWLHLLIVYAFMLYIPMSKHAHLLFAPFNYFWIQNRSPGELRTVNLDALEKENAEIPDSFGAKNLQDFSWLNILDSLSCIECGRCTVECPAHRTGKILDPKKIMTDLKDIVMLNNTKNTAVLDALTSSEEVWACTACNACVEACPVGNNQLDAIVEMRRHLVLNEGKMPIELQNAMNNIESQANPWGFPANSRSEWCQDLDVKTIQENKDADVLYWVGCSAAFDERNKKIARSFVKIMQEANVNFAILGNEEKCTGDSARRAGNEYLYQTLAKSNIETLNKYNFKKIVTACPHCFNTLGNEYSQLGGNYKVEHHSEFIAKLITDKKVQLDEKPNKKQRLTYHDSCYLGRMNEIYQEPRKILEKASGFDIVEASDHHEKSMCCGAGGAQMWMEEKHEQVNHHRSKQLIHTGANTIATACPFCMTMISDGVKSQKLDNHIDILDISEVVSKSMSQKSKA